MAQTLRNRGSATADTGFTAAYGSADFSYGNGSAKPATSYQGYGNTSSSNGYGATYNYGSQSTSVRSDAKGMNKKHKSQGNNSLLKILPWILTVLFFVTTMFCRSQTNASQARYSQIKIDLDTERRNHKTLQREHSHLDRDHDKKRTIASHLESKASALEKEIQKLNGQLSEKDEMLAQAQQRAASKNQPSAKMTAEMAELKKRDEALRKRIGTLVEKIELESYREAMERFGPGPHKVQMEVQMQDKSYETFTIQLHDLEKMPHSVNLFLQQVYHGLWDETSFVINAPHILQAGTLPVSGSGKTYDQKMEEFENMGLAQVSFQEYHKDYSHKEWTVGFAGRPGGPDFYINKMDNSKNHGPGGQKHHELKEEADPCFGFISEGKDTLKKIFSLTPGTMEQSFVLDTPVHIHKAVVMNMDGKKGDTASHNLKGKQFDFNEEYEDLPDLDFSE